MIKAKEDNQDFLRGIEEAAGLASVDVVERARQFNTKIVSWEDGHVVELSPDDFEIVYENGRPVTVRRIDKSSKAE
jgi:hypothetical protein